MPSLSAKSTLVMGVSPMREWVISFRSPEGSTSTSKSEVAVSKTGEILPSSCGIASFIGLHLSKESANMPMERFNLLK